MINVRTITAELPATGSQGGPFAGVTPRERRISERPAASGSRPGRRKHALIPVRWVTVAGLALLVPGCGGGADDEEARTQQLGKRIFNDENLSLYRNQSCAACHDLAWGTTGSVQAVNIAGAVYEGSVPGRFGNRKPPSSAYATLSPVLSFDATAGFIGGNFWDGRATGLRLGNPAADQAQGPFLNSDEQALPDAACVVYRVARSSYHALYRKVWGHNIFTIDFPPDTDALCAASQRVTLDAVNREKVTTEYDNIARAIATWEASREVSAYTSKFDAWRAGRAVLSADEENGWVLFNGKGKCARCHVANGPEPAFTDFTYDNIGVPKNPDNPVYTTDPSFIDTGLGGFLMSQPALGRYEPEIGKQKVPTLRNVDRRPARGGVKAYMHNGVFKSLPEIVHFYNTRDVLPACGVTPSPVIGVNCWPAPEVLQNLNVSEVGNLGLTAAEENALVAFLTTLSDGYID